MSFRAKQYSLVGALALATTVVVLFEAIRSSELRSWSRTLPDGSCLKIVSTAYGTNCSYELPTWPRWAAGITRHLPRPLCAALGRPGDGHGISTGSAPGDPILAIFTVREGRRNLEFPDMQAEFLDERGNLIFSEAENGSVGDSNRKGTRKLNCWAASKFPTELKTIILRFWELDADRNPARQVAQFFIPNPAANTRSH